MRLYSPLLYFTHEHELKQNALQIVRRISRVRYLRYRQSSRTGCRSTWMLRSLWL